MPTSPARVKVLLAGLGVLVLPFLALAVPGTAGPAVAEPTATPEPSSSAAPPEPSPSCTGLACVIPTSPPAVPSASPSPSVSPTPSRTATASPRPHRARTAAPARPRTTPRVRTETAPAVSETVGVGGVSGVPTATPTAAKDASSGSGLGLKRLLVIVLGAALLLGLSGAAGLYLTRDHD